jgi:hypothetical protein
MPNEPVILSLVLIHLIFFIGAALTLIDVFFC